MSKFGACRLCPKGSPETRLYGDRLCAAHLRDEGAVIQRSDVRLGLKREAERNALLQQFWLDQVRQIPAQCENQCGKALRRVVPIWMVKGSICHILEKRHFESVIVHPFNRFFGCLDCHHAYDDLGHSHQSTMRVWPVVKERFLLFMEFIKPGERQYLHPELWEMLDKAHPL